MTGSRQAIWGWRSAGVLLAALALALRLLIPTGFMLSPAAGADATLVICTGQGAMTVAVGADGKAHEVSSDPAQPHGDDAKTNHACAFAIAGIGLTAPLLSVAAAPVALAQGLAVPRLMTQRPGLGLAAPPPPTTGPPARP